MTFIGARPWTPSHRPSDFIEFHHSNPSSNNHRVTRDLARDNKWLQEFLHQTEWEGLSFPKFTQHGLHVCNAVTLFPVSFRNAGATFSADVLDTKALQGSKWAEIFQATRGIGGEVVSRFYKTRADLKPFHIREKRQKLVAQPQHQRDSLKHRNNLQSGSGWTFRPCVQRYISSFEWRDLSEKSMSELSC
jgi:hypothetical protein